MNQIAESYPNLKYLNLGGYDGDRLITDKVIWNVIHSCLRIQEFIIYECKVFNITIKEIELYLKIKYINPGFSDKSLFVIVELYPNLRYLNLWNAQITDKGLYAIARSCYKLEYLNISYCRNISDKFLFEITGNCHNLQEFYFAEACRITDKSISCIINLYLNLQKLDIVFSREDVKDASTLIIIKRSPNLKHIEISGNDINDKVTETLVHTCHKLEYLDLSCCSFSVNHRFVMLYISAQDSSISNSNTVILPVQLSEKLLTHVSI
ncbi:1240_t:CDS:2 [Funneliformis geosporum]|uniref:1240_t:CDS:1 n=1 Tax=Funneliformis geosporum TaxID=1117311 RepID=A0A9W4WTV8_9GLOM|nr:1240_t:CDS:2 [Funneliformis geosporum]